MVFNDEEFQINRNYIPDLFLGLNELNQDEPVHIALDMDKVPMVFVLFFRKIMQGSATSIDVYYKENTEILKTALKSYGMPYLNIKDFPHPLPDSSTIKE